jgi:hypothetical protein
MDSLDAIVYIGLMGKSRETSERYEQHVLDLPGVTRAPRRLYTPEDVVRLHEALEPFLDVKTLHRCVAESRDVYEALRVDTPPREIQSLLGALAAIMRPVERMQVKSPSDIAGMLMIEMGSLQQEEFRTVLLDTRNRLQAVKTIYKGSLNASLIRVGEVFREAIRYNSAAIILAHNHPSNSVDPSPEDVLVTREIVAAGTLLDTDVLDHIIIGQNKWLSMREKGLGFS